MHEREIFDAALSIADPELRTEFLAGACGDDERLRRHVEGLLAVHADVGDFLRKPPIAGISRGPEESILEQPGTRIGSYLLVEELGRGGMGIVYRAEQDEPVRRAVAVKVIKPGMDTREVIARFETERQALAIMNHPHIAQVFDGGMAASGRPYFVMELVHGMPITDYCRHRALDLEARLELFLDVCGAVQHAHLKGVIHRDLKPSNVLVASGESRPQVKVIDFGIAKALGPNPATQGTATDARRILGTPMYMSPEQAAPGRSDVDSRTDVYTLGVLLYELLTDNPPFDERAFSSISVDEWQRIVCEVEPPRPSARLSTLDGANTRTVSVPVKNWDARLRGDLDWIVLKAMEKDRERRYETVDGLATDIRRFLAGEPVLAAPPSRWYRLRKFVRRNRGAVLAASLLLTSLLLGTGGTLWGWIQARKQETVAQQMAQIARDESLAAEQARVAASERAEAEHKAKIHAEAISRFVVEDFLALTSVEGQYDFGGEGRELLSKDTTLLQLLDRAADKLRARANEMAPETEAMLCWIVGANYDWAGCTTKGVPFLERAVQLRRESLGQDHLVTLRAMNTLAVAYEEFGRTDEAVLIAEEALKLGKSRQGAEFLEPVTTAMETLGVIFNKAGNYDRALPLLEETVQLRRAKLGPEHHATLYSMSLLALCYGNVNKLDLAQSLMEETLKLQKASLGAKNPQTLHSMTLLADLYLKAGKQDLALSILEDSLKLTRGTLGDDHPDTLEIMVRLGSAYGVTGRLDSALPILEETLKLQKARLGDEHRDTLNTMRSLGDTYVRKKQYDKALPLCQESLKLHSAKWGADRRETLNSMRLLGNVYVRAGQSDQGLPMLQEALKRQTAILGAERTDTLFTMSDLGRAYHISGRPDLAVPLLEDALKLYVARMGDERPETLTIMTNLALAYTDTEQHDKALQLREKILSFKRATLGAAHPDTLDTMNDLAVGYWRQGRLNESVPMFEELVEHYEKQYGRKDRRTIESVANLGVNYKDAGRIAEALPLLVEADAASKTYPAELGWVGAQLLDGYFRSGQLAENAKPRIFEILADLRKQLPMHSPQLAGELAKVGQILLTAQAFAEAEPLCRECLEIREQTMPDHWLLFNSQSMLGGALLGQKKYVEAEPLLLAGYEGMKVREPTIPAIGQVRLTDTLSRLVELYAALDKPDDVKKWQAELDQRKTAR